MVDLAYDSYNWIYNNIIVSDKKKIRGLDYAKMDR